MATGITSSLGIGSGLAFQDILDGLRQREETIITNQKAEIEDLNTKTEALDALTLKLYPVKTQTLNLSLKSNFLQKSLKMSNSSIVSGTVLESAEEGSHSLEVTQLAQKSTYTSSTSYAKETDIINSTKDTVFAYEINGTKYSIDVPKNTTISGLTKLINAKTESSKVKASIINTGVGTTPYSLILQSTETGEDNRITMLDSHQSTLSFKKSDGTTDETYTSKVDNVNSGKAFTFSYTIKDKDGKETSTKSIDVKANTSLEDFVAQINNLNDSSLSAKIISYKDGSTTKYKMQLSDLTPVGGSLAIKDYASWTSDNTVNKTDNIAVSAAGNAVINYKDASGTSKSVTIAMPLTSATPTTYESFVSKVNSASNGEILASLEEVTVNGTTKYKLKLENKTGNSDAITLSNTGTISGLEGSSSTTLKSSISDATNLNSLSMTINSGQDTENSLNAKIKLNGIEYQRQKNDSLDNLILGATLNLNAVGTSTVNITTDKDSLKETIKEFVTNIADFMTTLREDTKMSTEEDKRGALATEGLSSVKSNITSILTMSVKVNATSTITSFFDLGLQISSDGTISIDEEKLTTALDEKFSEVKDFFLGSDENGKTITGFGETIHDKLTDLSSTSDESIMYLTKNRLSSKVETLNDEIEKKTELLDIKYEAMKARFARVDTLIGQMQSEGTQLASMLSADTNS